jgi:hypothetical protein
MHKNKEIIISNPYELIVNHLTPNAIITIGDKDQISSTEFQNQLTNSNFIFLETNRYCDYITYHCDHNDIIRINQESNKRYYLTYSYLKENGISVPTTWINHQSLTIFIDNGYVTHENSLSSLKSRHIYDIIKDTTEHVFRCNEILVKFYQEQHTIKNDTQNTTNHYYYMISSKKNSFNTDDLIAVLKELVPCHNSFWKKNKI